MQESTYKMHKYSKDENLILMEVRTWSKKIFYEEQNKIKIDERILKTKKLIDLLQVQRESNN